MSAKKANKSTVKKQVSAKRANFAWLSKFTLDTRAIDAFRILLALVLIYDMVLLKLPSFDMFFAQNGVLPVTECYKATKVSFLSPYFWIKSDTFTLGLMYATLGFYVLYGLGIALKFVKPIAWYLHLAIMLRNVYVTYGYDFYTDHALFFAMFLPMGNHYSPSFKNVVKDIKLPHPLVVFALVLQVFFLYLNTGLGKYGDTWMQGYAVRNMVADTTFNSPLKDILLNSAPLYKFFTYFVLFIEYVAPILLLVSFFKPNKLLRYLPIVMLFLLHIGIELFADVGTFSYISMAVLVVFLPASFWDGLERLFRVKKQAAGNYTPATMHNVVKAFMLSVIGLLVVLNVGYMLFHTAITKPLFPKLTKRYFIDPVGMPFRHLSICWQYWGMFAPNPMADTGWIDIEYEQAGTFPVNILDMRDASMVQPTYVPKGLEKLYMFYMRLWPNRLTQLKLLCYWADYKIKRFKEEHPDESIGSEFYIVCYQRYLGVLRKESYAPLVRKKYTLKELEDYLYNKKQPDIDKVPQNYMRNGQPGQVAPMPR